MFIDETWVKTNMAPLRGWGPRGKRLKAHAPYGHWKTLTFIAALRQDRIDAPFVIDGPINGELFRLYVETVLSPTLSPGDVVVPPDLPAALQPRPQPHRAGVRQTQAPCPKGPAAPSRNHLAQGRPAPRALHPCRMRKLPAQRRLWFRVSESRSMTLAAVDRLVPHATIFEMNVDSYRRRSAMERVRGPGRPPSRATAKSSS